MNEGRSQETKKNPEEKDVLNLPSRVSVHRNKKAAYRQKLSFIWFNFLLGLFILIILVVFTHPYWSGLLDHDLITEDPASYIEEISIK
ncbi:hypothetical protein [Halobacillus sp. Marseille-P3879]|uniref:hypothetical protein n=1 Tax=Halobacillus sp. Marseille-P3879 TaxID=2045014 RepID=UPI000C7A85CC|nr:hypothetical protein [Halobacillus sp. Marseille-P3879]